MFVHFGGSGGLRSADRARAGIREGAGEAEPGGTAARTEKGRKKDFPFASCCGKV